MTYDSNLFLGTAPYYERGRASYAPAAIEFIAGRLRVVLRARLIDLVCGPGTLARRFASRVREVVAIDPDADMLIEGRRLAAAEGVSNITWLRLISSDLNE